MLKIQKKMLREMRMANAETLLERLGLVERVIEDD